MRSTSRSFAFIALAALVPFTVGCSNNRLTRDQAAGNIKGQVLGLLTVSILDGVEPTGWVTPEEYAKTLLKLGIIKVGVGEKKIGNMSFDVYVPTEVSTPFLVERPRSGSKERVLVLARAMFNDISGITEPKEAKSADVEFTWVWRATEGAKLLNGVALQGILGQPPISTAVDETPHVERASCRLWDDGWRCDVPVIGNRCLSDRE